MSHAYGWRGSCAAGDVTDVVVGSGALFGPFFDGDEMMAHAVVTRKTSPTVHSSQKLAVRSNACCITGNKVQNRSDKSAHTPTIHRHQRTPAANAPAGATTTAAHIDAAR